ncbi:MAG: fibronectin type III domain-containing protein, partial [Planctomycetaceae bacterium]|nr:fibronectin type III domain-containing protein [Planctomycetaceae bacterium]
GYFVTLADSKGIIYQGVVSGVEFDSSKIAGLQGELVPGVTYNVIVNTIVCNGTTATKSVASSASATTLKFSDASLKIPQGQKVALTGVNLAIADNVATLPTSFTRKYVIEYTYIADAKGKADWSTALTQDATNLTLTGLKAGTQYYARLVAYDAGTTSMTEKTSTKIVIGKEFKFKTVAAPLATITKPAFKLVQDNSSKAIDMALSFTGKVPVDSTNAPILQSGTKFFYELIISTDAVLDKTTGKLANGKSFTSTPAALEAKGGSGNDKNDFKVPISVTLTGDGSVFEVLDVYSLDQSTFKALNFQLLVHYSKSAALTDVYATAYTKVTKLTLPKWFV